MFLSCFESFKTCVSIGARELNEADFQAEKRCSLAPQLRCAVRRPLVVARKKSGCGRRSSLGRARAAFAGPIAVREEERDDADDERLRRGKKIMPDDVCERLG